MGRNFLGSLDSNLTVVMGGQFGSEGKGEIVAHLAREYGTTGPFSAIRTGGPNAGHTVTEWEPDEAGQLSIRRRVKMRHIPAAFVNPSADLFLSGGGLIDQEVLDEEISELVENWGWTGNFGIDQMAMKITEEHKHWEVENGMRARIGSTTEGIGAARVDKIRRLASIIRDNGLDFSEGSPLYRLDLPVTINKFLDDDEENERGMILIESTQGFGLSLETSGCYPYATSTNITPGHLLGECGISSNIYHHVLAVMRTYPIRVAGNSGPLHNELTWEEMAERAPGRASTPERTTVTKLVRRIGEWDRKLAERMTTVCRPDAIALTFLDYVFPELGDVIDADQIMEYPGVKDYISAIEQDCQAPVALVSTGPGRVADIWG